MQEWIVQMTNDFGYLGIWMLIFLENVFPPSPSEVILPFSGFLTTYTKMGLWGVILSATVGSVTGGYILYGAGYLLNEERLEQVLDGKIGKILHFKKEDVKKTMAWFHKYGNATVFFCRCVPVLRSLISIPAGMTKMSLITFTLYTTVGSFIWNVLLVSLGAWAGDSWGTISGYIAMYSDVVKIVLGGAIIGVIVYYFRRKRNNKA
ncbi:MAG: DedA family protein [Lachnospiraceae bacterium]|nr:DedA family protein [Lachnospiraceae bacterium]